MVFVYKVIYEISKYNPQQEEHFAKIGLYWMALMSIGFLFVQILFYGFGLRYVAD